MALELQMATPGQALHARDGTLVDLVDGLLDMGVVLRGEVWLSVADVDLVFLGLDLVLTSQNRVLQKRPSA